MDHALMPLALALLALGALCSSVGWVVDTYVESASSRISRSVLWSGLAVLTAGIVVLAWPFFASLLTARPV